MTTVEPGTPAWLRTQNDLAAFRLLLERGPLSRTQLGSLSGMSKPTAGQMVARLEKLGLVRAVGEISEARGPNAALYGVREDAVTGVAVNILADVIQAVVTDALGTVHPTALIPLGGDTRSPEADIRHAVDAACAAAGVAIGEVCAVAIGVQAAVDTAADALSFTDTLPGWPQEGAAERIEDATGMTVVLENDVTLAAIAERSTPERRAEASFAYVWLGDGIGAAVDMDGTVLRGVSGAAGEIGYLEVPRSAAALDPDALDYTDLLGGPAVVRLLGGAASEPLTSALERLDDAAREALADRIALVVTPLAVLLDPGLVVLGGPTGATGGDALAALVQQRVDSVEYAKSDLRAVGERVRIGSARAGADPVLRGARQLLVDHLRARLEERIVAS